MKNNTHKFLIEIEVKTSPEADAVFKIKREHKSANSQPDEWRGIVADYLEGGFDGHPKKQVTMREMGLECLKLHANNFKITEQRRIGAILRSLGWYKKYVRQNGKNQHVWFKTPHILLNNDQDLHI